MSEVRFGLVGYGLWGQHHARAIADTDGADLTAIAAATSDSRQRAEQAYANTTVLNDYRQLVNRSDVDLVDIVLPNFLHYEVARAALEAGKHVLLEKPMALTAAQCRQLVELAAQKRRLLALNHELRLSTLWGRLRDLIDAGTIGTGRHAIIELSRFPYRTGSGGWRYDPVRVGDWILEEPIHFFDLARWYLADSGEPRSVFARANRSRNEQSALHDNFSAIVEFAGGAYAVISQSLAAFGHHVSAKVVGTQGAVWAWWSGADARASAHVRVAVRCWRQRDPRTF